MISRPKKKRNKQEIHTCVHAYKHTNTHTNIHTCMDTNMVKYIYTYTHTYVHTYTHTHIHACTHTHLHSHIYEYLLTQVAQNTHIFIWQVAQRPKRQEIKKKDKFENTYIHRSMHTHIHTFSAHIACIRYTYCTHLSHKKDQKSQKDKQSKKHVYLLAYMYRYIHMHWHKFITHTAHIAYTNYACIGVDVKWQVAQAQTGQEIKEVLERFQWIHWNLSSTFLISCPVCACTTCHLTSTPMHA